MAHAPSTVRTHSGLHAAWNCWSTCQIIFPTLVRPASRDSPTLRPRSNGKSVRYPARSICRRWSGSRCRRPLRISGVGSQPYLQLPWSWERNDGWGLSGMITEFLRPAEPATKRVTETTFAVEKKLTETFSLFTKYVGRLSGERRPDAAHQFRWALSFERNPTNRLPCRVWAQSQFPRPCRRRGLFLSARWIILLAQSLLLIGFRRLPVNYIRSRRRFAALREPSPRSQRKCPNCG